MTSNSNEIEKNQTEIDTKDISGAFSSQMMGWYPAFSSGYGVTSSGQSMSPIQAMGIPTFNACIQRISNDIAGLPLIVRKFTQRSGWQYANDHDVATVLRNPNKRQRAFDYVEFLVKSYLLSGNGYSAIIFQPNGRPSKLIPIIPITATVREDFKGDLLYTVSSKLLYGERTSKSPITRGRNARVEPDNTWIRTMIEDEMLHIRDTSLDGGIYGTSRITLGMEALGLASVMQEAAARMWKNSANFNIMLVLPPEVKNEDTAKKAATQANFTLTQAGAQNSGHIPVIGGGMKVEKLNATPAEAQALEAREFQNAEIARVCGVPASLLGLRDQNGYKNAESDIKTYIDRTLLPIILKIEQELKTKLFYESEYDDYHVSFDTRKLLRGDSKTRLENYQMASINGFVNPDYVADEEGWKRPPDGSDYRILLNTGVTGDTSGLDLGGSSQKPKKPKSNVDTDSDPNSEQTDS